MSSARTPRRTLLAATVGLATLNLQGCIASTGNLIAPPPIDAGPVEDAGQDAGTTEDAGATDDASTAPSDPDAGTAAEDAGPSPSDPDAGSSG